MTLIIIAIIGGCLLPNFDNFISNEEIVTNCNSELNNNENKTVSANGYTYLLSGLVILGCVAVRMYLQVDPPHPVDVSSWNLYWYSPRDYLHFLSLPRGSASEMYNYSQFVADKPLPSIF